MKKQGIFSAILPMLISLLALSAFAQDEAYIYNDDISSNTIDGGVNSQINTDIPDNYEDFSIGTIINKEYGMTVPSQSTITNDYEPPYTNLTPNVIFGNGNKSSLTIDAVIDMTAQNVVATQIAYDGFSGEKVTLHSVSGTSDIKAVGFYYATPQPQLEYTPFFYDDKCLKLKDLMKYLLFAMEFYIDNDGTLRLRFRGDNNAFNTNSTEAEHE